MRNFLLSTAGLAVTVLLLAPHLGLAPPLAIKNTSPSVPLGWWVWTPKWPPERGDVVAMKDPPFWPMKILLKRVEGTGGDTFCWHDGRHWINDRPMPELDPMAFDMEALNRDRGFTIWRGCLVLKTREVAGFGEGGLSYGSAFFGPVDVDRLWGVYERWSAS